jgi:hypothetical protein
MRTRIGAALSLALLLLAVSVRAPGWAYSAGTIEAPTRNSVPCPARVQPNVAQVSWSTFNRKTQVRHAGQRIIWQLHRVRSIYRAICGLDLIQPLVETCPGNPGGESATYHVTFLLWTKDAKHTLLRVTENKDGCITLAVDGQADLGAAGLLASGLFVP